MNDEVRRFHVENLEAALKFFFKHGFLDPQVKYLKDGELHYVVTPDGRDANQVALLRSVVEEDNPDIVNFVCMGSVKKRRRSESEVRNNDIVLVSEEKKVMIAVTFAPNGKRYFSAFDIRKEGDGLMIAKAEGIEDIDGKDVMIRDD